MSGKAQIFKVTESNASQCKEGQMFTKTMLYFAPFRDMNVDNDPGNQQKIPVFNSSNEIP